MKKVIIAIHGRSEKPSNATLLNWWRDAIEEGLEKNQRESLGDIPVEMAYYADVHYAKPQPVADNEEPYYPADPGALQPYRARLVDRLREETGEWLNKPMDWLEEHSGIFSKLARKVSGKLLKDLGDYYSHAKDCADCQQPLRELLLQYRDHEIILVAHSMGCIISYDVLRQLGADSSNGNLRVSHYITMGAPLGLTPVKGQIIRASSRKRLRTPSVVSRSWVNFSDPGDFVCLDSHLADDYPANSAQVQVRDVLVANDYPNNPHKSYGYLRTPEFSAHLAGLL